MNWTRKLCVKADLFTRGQTMAEYALLLASVAIVVYAGYSTMGKTITTVLSGVDGKI